ncbi:unnamed protein product [Trichobilharzia szidati]|nr:unnamed protein product [Trichobilharzia szidati]
MNFGKLPQVTAVTLFLIYIHIVQSVPMETNEVKSSFLTNNITAHNTSDGTIFQVYPTWIDFATRFVPMALFVDRYVTIIYYILGFPGNLLSLIIWSNKRMVRENSAAVYLAALSINDIIVLIFALHRDLSRVWNIHQHFSPGSCEVQNILSPAVQYASPLFVLAFTVERWLAICKPFAIDRICSPRRAIYICFSIIIGTILVCSGHAYIFITENNTCNKRHINALIVSVYLSCLEAVFAGVVPLLVLIFNCLVIKELAKVHRANKQLALMSNQLSSSSTTPSMSITGQNELQIKPKILHKNKIKSCFKSLFSTQNTYRHSSTIQSNRKRTNDKLISTNPSIETNLNMRSSREIPKYSDKSLASRHPVNSFDNNGRPTIINGRPHISSRISSDVVGLDFNASRKSSHGKRTSPSFKSTTLMLLTISFYTILTTLLGGLVYLIHQTQEEPNMNVTEMEALKDPVWNRYFTTITIKAFGDEIALSHYAFGFIIYYATGCNFRLRVHQLFRGLFYRLGCRCEALMRLGLNDDSENIPSFARRSHNRLLTNGDRLDNNFDNSPHSHHPHQQKLLTDTKSTTNDQSSQLNKSTLFRTSEERPKPSPRLSSSRRESSRRNNNGMSNSVNPSVLSG